MAQSTEEDNVASLLWAWGRDGPLHISTSASSTSVSTFSNMSAGNNHVNVQ
jgi:hypothetical protein